jgi:hypothetical protein
MVVSDRSTTETTIPPTRIYFKTLEYPMALYCFPWQRGGMPEARSSMLGARGLLSRPHALLLEPPALMLQGLGSLLAELEAL